MGAIVGLAAAGAAAIAVSAYLASETVRVDITETNIRTDRIDGELRIVQISDLHGRTKLWGGTVSSIVNSLKPDIVCVTGDLFNRLDQLPRVLDDLSRLECDAVYFVPGNHEWDETVRFRRRRFTAAEHEAVLRRIGAGGIRILANAGQWLDRNGSRIFVYGFDNSVYGREAYKPPEGRADHAFRLMLAHSPSIARWLGKQGIGYELLLTGHTHGGQIRPFGKAIGPYGKFHCGLKEVFPGRYFYINRGLGTIRLPFRLACRPEISLFRIGTGR